ncbi:MAG TPA: TIGR02281 family clan AA aspartic protease [Cellvibrionaceae bacterium]
MAMKKLGFVCALMTVIAFFAMPLGAAELAAKMLADGSALIEVNGKQHMLRVGQQSPEGVTLISANRSQAVVSYQQQEHTLTLSRQIATSFSKAEYTEVRIASGHGGHYMTPGRINGMPVEFMVDTGATSIAMNSVDARRLGINYTTGQSMQVSTANGLAPAYKVWLDSVTVGTITIKHVEAFVISGRSPHTMLLGNSFLKLVDMTTERGVLVLRAQLN